MPQGQDIPDAEQISEALGKTDTRLRLFFVKIKKSPNIDDAMIKMPKQIPPLPGTMRGHKVVTLGPEYIKTSAACAHQFNCQWQWDNPDLIGKWCIVNYNNNFYPGVINIQKMHAQVKCIHCVGKNRFFWPHQDDILWYLLEDILDLIPAPRNGTKHHVKILKKIHLFCLFVRQLFVKEVIVTTPLIWLDVYTHR